MEPKFNCQVTVIGGDSRQITVACVLTDLFQKVKIYGHPQTMVPNSLDYCENLADSLNEAEVIVLPIGGMNEQGLVRSYQGEQPFDFGSHFTMLPEGTLIVGGSFTERWVDLAKSLKLNVLEYADDDEIAILNSIPTAEGTLQIAMEELPITIHGSNVLIMGFGRVAITLARVFKALGAQVIVAARRKSQLARALEMGCRTALYQSLAVTVNTADLIINTIPALVLDSRIISLLKPETLIIDLASAPGGTDFETAKKLNIKAILAPGLPGLVAPKTAGAILAASIPPMIVQFLQAGGGSN